MLLEVRHLVVTYNGVRALDGVSLSANTGEIIAVVGPNGAGKSTLLRATIGLVRTETGEIVFANKNIENISPHELAERGIVFVPQDEGVFNGLTVYENLRLTVRSPTGKTTDAIRDVLCTFPNLASKQKTLASRLSGGERRMLALARVFTSPAKLLLIDEPSAGLDPESARTILRRIKSESHRCPVVLAEQNVHLALELCTRVCVLMAGHVTYQGPPEGISAGHALPREWHSQAGRWEETRE